MTDSDICKTYSDETLEGIVRDLSSPRAWQDQWSSRLEAAQAELARRKATARR